MNPWWWRIGLGLGAGAATYGLRRLIEPDPDAHQPRPSDDLFPDALTIMGHRGAAAVAPENTMSAFGVAARLGLPFELDVQQCNSGEPVVFHDATIERTTNGNGRIADMSWSLLKTFDAGAKFAPEFAGLRIPSLDTVLATLGREVVINIEIKRPTTDRSLETLATAVVKVIRAHEVTDHVMVSSFEPLILEAVGALEPNIRRGMIIGAGPVKPAPSGPDNPTSRARLLFDSFARRNLRWLERARPDLLMVDHTLVTARYVERTTRLGYRLFAWTVNDVAEAKRLVDAGIDGIITDHPRRLMMALKPPIASGQRP